MFLRLPSVHHDDQGPFATEEVDEELEEGVDCESFVHVAERVEVEGCILRHKTGPGRGGIDGDHEQDSDDISLKERLAVVLDLKPDGDEGNEGRDEGRDAADGDCSCT